MKLPIVWDTILLPKAHLDLTKWAVVACDQYTSNEEYWQQLDKKVGRANSTLRMILPEVYLGRGEDDARIKKIASVQKKYLEADIFDIIDSGVVVVSRTTTDAKGVTKTRVGIMLTIDLAAYSYTHADRAMIRATEGTVEERVPPRAAVRSKCELESPHIMLLVDDPDKTLVEPLAKMMSIPLYDTELNNNGGRVTGALVKGRERVVTALRKLLEDSVAKHNSPFLFGVGDGNHSLASAKAVYESNPTALNRYALVEVVNIYDDGIEFEPIHRLVKGSNGQRVYDALIQKLGVKTNAKALPNIMLGNQRAHLKLPSDAIKAVAKVQAIIDDEIMLHGGEVDYIHGEQELNDLAAANDNNVGVLLPSLKKDTLFAYVANKGALPRKTFSMGEAWEKRYYLECRKIK